MSEKDFKIDKTQAAHSIFRAADVMGWDLGNPDTFLAKLKNVEYGLGAETEFGALLIWLGSCALVHGLDQHGFSAPKTRIPDLFAVFERQGARLTTLIEVKTTQKQRLSFRRDYLEGLIEYSRILGHPLLIAWKCIGMGIWCIFDWECGNWEAERWSIDVVTAFKNDLMGLVADEFYAAPYRGPYLELSGPVIETDRNRRGSTTGFSFRIDQAAFLDRDGVEMEKLPDPVSALLYATIEPDVEFDEKKMRVIARYFVKDTLVPSQQLLKMLVGKKFHDGERIRWRNVAKEMESIITRSQLRHELRSAGGEYVKALFRVIPARVPKYVPSQWRKKGPRS